MKIKLTKVLVFYGKSLRTKLFENIENSKNLLKHIYYFFILQTYFRRLYALYGYP